MLNITSMMDMMTIILVFLLKSYSTDDISIAASEDLRLPISTSEKPPKLAVNVVVSRVDVVVDGEWVMNLEEVPDEETGEPVIQVPEGEKRGQMISSLFDALQAKADTAKSLGQKAGTSEFDFKGQVLLQCDKRLSFSVIREVMFTAGQAQFGEFRFVVIKGSG
jgi:biopolymer transport protein ExbD